jgi:hypothetical protein
VGRETSFFRGSELSRLLVLVAVLVVGLLLFWQFGRSRPLSPAPPVVVEDRPEPIEPDRSIEFESVTDRTPMRLGDNAAYKRLLEKARARTPVELAKESRRDVLMSHLWERPEHYRGVPIHLDGTALQVRRFESKFSRTGWLYEAWVNTPDSGRFGYNCVFEEPPKGFPIGANVSERVVFNGYFLKIWKYEAADVVRGAPLLIGRIGWDSSQSADAQVPGSGSTLKWTLVLLAFMFFVTLTRWIATLGRSFGRRDGPKARFTSPSDEIDAATLEQWVRNAGDEEAAPVERFPESDSPTASVEAAPPGDPANGADRAPSSLATDAPEPSGGIGRADGLVPSEDSGARPADEAQSKSSPVRGG